VFGATGMLGKPVAERLITEGHSLTTLVRPGLVRPGKEKHLSPSCNIVVGDLKNRAYPFGEVALFYGGQDTNVIFGDLSAISHYKNIDNQYYT